MINGFVVTLEPVTQELARYFARLKQKSNRKHGVTQNKITKKKSALWIETNGTGGELAFCELYNVWPDLTIGPRSGGPDCTLHDGRTVDVKTTEYQSGRLMTQEDKNMGVVDIYALMVGVGPTYRFVGWALTEELLDRELRDIGDGPSYIMERDELRPPETLIDGGN